MRLVKPALLYLGFSLFFGSQALADETSNTGNELKDACNQRNYEASSLMWGVCLGYVSGVHKGFIDGILTTLDITMPKETAEKKFKFTSIISGYCIPSNATREQMGLVVSKYLEDHPEALNKDDVTLVIDAFQAAWPCPANQLKQ